MSYTLQLLSYNAAEVAAVLYSFFAIPFSDTTECVFNGRLRGQILVRLLQQLQLLLETLGGVLKKERKK